MKTMFLFIAIALPLCEGICQSQCGNLDFENGNFEGWKTYAGDFWNIDSLSVESFHPDRFKIMSGGFDPNTGNVIPVVASGGAYSCRMGNQNTGAQAEKITYTMTITEANALFVYRYAIVLEDPGHSVDAQPQFEVKILDETGTIADSACGYYQVTAAAGIPGFQEYGHVVYKNWTTVGMDLSPYIGQEITICFIVRDCAHGGHFGYAYVDAESAKMQIETYACKGSDTIMFAAPHGFEYLWMPGGHTGRTFTVPADGSVETYSCLLTSVTGCQVLLSASSEIINIDPSFSFSSCDSVFFKGECMVDSSDVVSWLWDFGDGSTGTGRRPIHAFDAGTGPYTVNLTVTTNKNCIESYSHGVKVILRPSAALFTEPLCAGFERIFTDKSADIIPGTTKYMWDFGDGTQSAEKMPVKSYSDPGEYLITLTVTNGPGCRDREKATILINDCEVEIPNVFTPNEDEWNEYFFIRNLEVYSTRTLIIFNRWGYPIFRSEDYRNDWQPLNISPGVYYYVLEYGPVPAQNEMKTKAGFVTVLK